ncbi:VCBS repeat-containing protein [Labrenzia sp. R4_2]|uniref:FG-GAP-like repeat-containing protein n=1 Tax=Labrenzia sp. R4_2 TaxID=2821107 RepID=UPI001ADC98B4|nr:FG-GAP-like repeat-containing protein [Labrenzia sp. R4_2]MBO9420307.1 VCBS repeat-containing protein [Labrenzia sp. R4_2]
MISFENTSTFRVSTSATVNQVAIADITGDGKAELLVTAFSIPIEDIPHEIKLYSPDRNGGFVDITSTIQGGAPSGVHSRQILTTDLNGDGVLDFYIAGHGYDAQPFPGEVNALILSTGSGGVVNSTSLLPQTNSFTHSAAAADVDMDGDIDILDGNGGPNETGPSLLKNEGNAYSVSTGFIDGYNEKAWTYGFLNANGDNTPDLYATSRGGSGNPSYIMYGRGDGTYFNSGIDLPALPSGFEEIDTQIVDLNGDGRDDIVASSYAASSFMGLYTRVLIQQADGSFVDETSSRIPGNDLSSSAWRERVYFADLDQDGDLDAIVQNNTGLNYNEIWENDGSGRFTSSAVTLPAQSFSRVAIGDVDGDNKTDIIAVQGDVAHVLTNTSTTERFVGTEGADTYVGSSSANIINLNGGDDTVTPLGGNDTVDGGLGTDKMVLSGAQSDYTLTQTTGGFTITGPDGQDFVTGIENFEFSSGGTVSLTQWLAPHGAGDPAPVFRFYNEATGVHFYAGTEAEALNIMATLETFNFESVAFRAAPAGGDDLIDVFRFFNTATGTHFYTASSEERDSVIANLPQLNYEGVAYEAFSQDNGARVAVHRFYNEATGTHFFTASEAEKDSVSTLTGFNYEGVAYWALA